jgi:ABC-type proline/glycine betaine transport system ATPase subunit
MEGIPYDETLDVSVGDTIELMTNQIGVQLEKQSPLTVSNPNRDFVKATFGWEQNVNRLLTLLQDA